MKAIAITPGTSTLQSIERPEPPLGAADEIKVKVLEVGICGTDREEAAGGRAKPPDGQTQLVLGHEMLGRVVEAGPEVRRVRPGDYVVLSVRRGCGRCLPCAINRPDMCQTGEYRERGIWRMDGYQTEFVTDSESYAVPVPEALKTVAVLLEPFSVAEKAIEEALRLQSSRSPSASVSPSWISGGRALVAGLGPVGLLAAVALRLRGAEVFGFDIVEPDSARPKWLEEIGGAYIDGRRFPPAQAKEKVGSMDFIFEATGATALEFNLLEALSRNGIYVLTGIPGGDRPVQVPGAALIRQLVLNNQAMVGSVNAARDHFEMAVRDLHFAFLRWGALLEKVITRRYPVSEFREALTRHPADEIKSVIAWASG